MSNRSPHHAHWLAALVLAALVAGCGPSKRVGAVAVTGDLPDQEVSDFVLTETDKGALVWTLYARSAAIYDARNEIVGRGVRIDFFDDQGARSSTLTAREGLLQQQTRELTARGNVVMTTTEGTRMTTEELHFLSQTEHIVSDRKVRVERAGDVLEGIGFESDKDLRHFEFKHRIQATIRTRSEALLDSHAQPQGAR